MGDWSSSEAWTVVTNGTVSGDYVTVNYVNPYSVAYNIPQQKKESALEWLDRRVDEMRVAL